MLLIKKMLKNKLILGIIIGISITSTVVYAACLEAKDISFTSSTGLKSTNVEDAIKEVNNKCTASSDNNDSNNNINNNNNNDNDNTTQDVSKTYKCKRATTLHTELCGSSYVWGGMTYNCGGAGYNEGDTITYGSLGTKGTLKSGDAFDCDVNGDGTYDSNTERFYYVSDYFDTQSKTFNTNYGVLIYYNNISNGQPYNMSVLWYHSDRENWHGLDDNTKKHLPSTSQWSNVSLYKTTRAILNEQGGNTTTGGTLPSNYSYSGYSARLITYQELKSGCSTISFDYGSLDTCQYLMENTNFHKTNMYGYWMETPYSNSKSEVLTIYGYNRNMSYSYADTINDGLRPVIEVLKTDIDY